MKKMCVIGSLNIDVVTSVDRFPKVGESVFADSFEVFTGGGKGANQAFALGRLGADVSLVGKIGDKFYGLDYLKILESNNVKCDTVEVEKGCYPGIGVITVDSNGDNSIVTYPGANNLVDVEYIKNNWDAISSCDIFLFQLEIPAETNLYVMEKLNEMNKTIIFDPAPVKEFSNDILKYVDFITPNETELSRLTGVNIEKEEDFRVAADVLIKKGVSTVIAKAGKNGAYIINKDDFTQIKACEGIKAVDPTAAGDSFNAGFAYGLARGGNVVDSIKFANVVAGLSTTAMGTQSAMPSLDQVNSFIKCLKC